MQLAILALFLAAILALFFEAPQQALRQRLRQQPRALLLMPLLLTAVFAAVLSGAGALSWQLVLAIGVYTFVPALVAVAQRTKPPSWTDAGLILFLWLPLEFAGAAASYIPRPAQGLVHNVAYGIAIFTALMIFVVFRQFPGMKYCWPESPRDLLYPLIAFVLVAPVLIALGLALSFTDPFHAPRASAVTLIARFFLILVATALPEEILFRSLIQNWLMQRFGATNAVLLASSWIFGVAHLNNGPALEPNWRYMIMAMIAGFAYGKVFQKASSVLSSATLHAMVNTTKHAFF